MRHFNRERGQSLVELAVSLLVLLYLLSGAVEFGLAFFQYVQLRDAAQEGALYGSMNPCNSAGILARVKGASDKPVNLSQDNPVLPRYVAITVTAKTSAGVAVSPATGAREGDALTVRVAFDHTVFMPFMSKFIGATLPLNAEVTDTVLTPPQGQACP